MLAQWGSGRCVSWLADGGLTMYSHSRRESRRQGEKKGMREGEKEGERGREREREEPFDVSSYNGTNPIRPRHHSNDLS